MSLAEYEWTGKPGVWRKKPKCACTCHHEANRIAGMRCMSCSCDYDWEDKVVP